MTFLFLCFVGINLLLILVAVVVYKHDRLRTLNLFLRALITEGRIYLQAKRRWFSRNWFDHLLIVAIDARCRYSDVLTFIFDGFFIVIRRHKSESLANTAGILFRILGRIYLILVQYLQSLSLLCGIISALSRICCRSIWLL